MAFRLARRAGRFYLRAVEIRGIKMKEQLIKLLKVKSIITLAVMAVFCVLALAEKIPSELTASVITAIVTYYFTKREETQEGDKNA